MNVSTHHIANPNPNPKKRRATSVARFLHRGNTRKLFIAALTQR